MKTDLFAFDLPPSRIAARPMEPREAARLLEVGDAPRDRLVGEFPSLLRPGDMLVLNDTKVIPARLYGRRDAVRVAVTLIAETGADEWRAFAKPARRLKPGQRIEFAPEFHAIVTARLESGEIGLRFNVAGNELRAALSVHGRAPLPPYIRREAGPDARDSRDYQTVYAARDGAVAAPTAGLHITEAMLAAVARQGVETAFVTLHVGAGTFLPVKTDEIEDHEIHAERGVINAAVAARINAARAAGGRIIAVGTTTLRLLESAVTDDGAVQPFDGETRLFVTLGHQFRTADLLMTNFHLPRSTLFMLVCAFAGFERMRDAYSHAIATGYRFYSYGDACLLHRNPAEME